MLAVILGVEILEKQLANSNWQLAFVSKLFSEILNRVRDPIPAFHSEIPNGVEGTIHARDRWVVPRG
jgi:hypothetical protein